MAEAIRIYVACLAAYNNGRLHGRWIDATQESEEIAAEVQAMLRLSPISGAEEWAIHDYEGFGPISLSEWESFDRVSEIAQGIEEHGEAFAAWLSGDTSRSAEHFSEQFAGTWDSEKDFAYNWVEETGSWNGVEVPEELWGYLDWDVVARDLMQDFSTHQSSDHRVFVFRSY